MKAGGTVDMKISTCQRSEIFKESMYIFVLTLKSKIVQHQAIHQRALFFSVLKMFGYRSQCRNQDLEKDLDSLRIMKRKSALCTCKSVISSPDFFFILLLPLMCKVFYFKSVCSNSFKTGKVDSVYIPP